MASKSHRILIVLLFLVVLFVISACIFHFQKIGKKESFDIPEKKTIEKELNSYVINLKKNQDRMLHFSKSYNSTDLGVLVPVQRYEAVNGNNIQLEKYVSSEVLLGIQQIDATNQRTSNHQLTKGMIGCYLSHLGVYEHAISKNKKYALVFEDDAKVSRDIYKSIKKIIYKDGNVPRDWDIILFGLIENDVRHYNNDYNLVKDFYGTHGYIIKRSAMKLLLSTLPIERQIDGQMVKFVKENKLKIYSLTTQKVGVENFGSDLQMIVTEM
jgi:GR25 family glycosyltransferase involved in LPS biosynthesis